MRHSRYRVAAVRGARIGVVDDGRSIGLTLPPNPAGFDTVTHARIRTARACRSRNVEHAEGCVTAIDSAGIAVVDGQRLTRATLPSSIAGLGTVAEVSIRARGAR